MVLSFSSAEPTRQDARCCWAWWGRFWGSMPTRPRARGEGRLLDLEELQTIRHWNAMGRRVSSRRRTSPPPARRSSSCLADSPTSYSPRFPDDGGASGRSSRCPRCALLSPDSQHLRGIRHLLRHYMGDALMYMVTGALTSVTPSAKGMREPPIAIGPISSLLFDIRRRGIEARVRAGRRVAGPALTRPRPA